MATITIVDETTAGQTLAESLLELVTERVTLRELIRSRVYQEVDDYNSRKLEVFQGLVEPRDAQRSGRGWKVRGARVLDWHEQFERAIDAVERRGVLVLVDDRQVTSLDEPLVVGPGTRVTFVRLVPLVGG